MARVLALSSHVAFGSVGLAAMVPALHWLGHEVIVAADGRAVEPPRLCAFCRRADPARRSSTAMLDALEANGWLNGTEAVISGYLPSPGACRRGTLGRRARPPRQRRRALRVRSGVRRRAGRHLSLGSDRLRHPRRSCCRLPPWRRPTASSCRGSPASPSGDPLEARQAAWALGRALRARHLGPGRRQPPRQRAGHAATSAPPATSAAALPPRTAPATCWPRCISAISSTAPPGVFARRLRLRRRCQRRRQHGPG